jgi:phage baseplate assembly protein W
MQPTNFQISLDGATLIDVNPNYGVDNLPDRLPDGLAITNCALYNLLNCAPGERARIFEPTFGSLWLHFLNEPIEEITAKKMEIFMVQSIEKWLPQIKVDRRSTLIIPDSALPGYKVRIGYATAFSSSAQQIAFQLVN